MAILYAESGEFDRKRFSPPIDADTPGDFFADHGDVAVLKTRDKITQPDGFGFTGDSQR